MKLIVSWKTAWYVCLQIHLAYLILKATQREKQFAVGRQLSWPANLGEETLLHNSSGTRMVSRSAWHTEQQDGSQRTSIHLLQMLQTTGQGIAVRPPTSWARGLSRLKYSWLSCVSIPPLPLIWLWNEFRIFHHFATTESLPNMVYILFWEIWWGKMTVRSYCLWCKLFFEVKENEYIYMSEYCSINCLKCKYVRSESSLNFPSCASWQLYNWLTTVNFVTAH
jgi:hypothetical protein